MATGGSTISRAPRPSSLADVLDLILDKGLVIDAYVRVSLAGIEVLTIDARVVVASVDTYLRFAEAVSRLDLTQTEQPGLTTLFGGTVGGTDGEGTAGGHGTGNDTAGQDGRDRGTRSLGEGAAAKRSRGVEASQESPAEEGASRTTGSGDADQGVLGRIAERARR